VQSSGQTDVRLSPMADEIAVNGADYHSISALAVVSLIVGIAAPLCLFAPLLWAVPLFGAALAIVALRRVAVSDGVMIGRRAALVGLVLCIGSLCAASSRTVFVRYLHTRQAAATGSRWIGLLQAGQIQQAFDLTTTSTQAPSPREGEHAPEEDLVTQFAATPDVQALVQIGQKADVRFERNLSYTPGGLGTCVVEQRYLVTPDDGQADRAAMAVRLTLQLGRVPGETWLQWLVVSCHRDEQAAGGGANGEAG
jgi:hypothetical protein